MQKAFFSRANIRSLVVILSFVFSFRWSIASPYEVPTPSMEPSIKVGDRVLGNHLAYRLRVPFTNVTLASWGTPARGDIVIFKSQTDPGINLVKRVIAVAGDAVSFHDGKLLVNGQVQTLEDAESDRSILADATDHPERKHLYREDLGILVDVKTTLSAHPDAFARSVVNYGYHAQEAFYSDGWNALGKNVDGFVFLAWEKTSPYAFGLYELPPAIVEEGRAIISRALDAYATCVRTDSWPAYGEGVQELDFKRWAYRLTEAPSQLDMELPL